MSPDRPHFDQALNSITRKPLAKICDLSFECLAKITGLKSQNISQFAQDMIYSWQLYNDGVIKWEDMKLYVDRKYARTTVKYSGYDESGSFKLLEELLNEVSLPKAIANASPYFRRELADTILFSFFIGTGLEVLASNRVKIA